MTTFSSSRHILYGVALAVFGGLGGAGVAWIVVGTMANSMSKSQGDRFVAASIPKLAAGGIVGFVAGVVIAVFLLRSASATALVAWEEKLIVRRGAMSIYAGIPVFFLALLFPAFEPLAQRFGNTAAPYIVLAVFLVFLRLSLFVYDRIPRRLIIPLGLLGWLLTFTLAFWYFSFGPGAFPQHHV